MFAEYDRELLEQYDIFARFGYEDQVIANRLEYYGAFGAYHKIVKIELLTDCEGLVFYEQAVKYAKDLVGVEYELPAGPSLDENILNELNLN